VNDFNVRHQPRNNNNNNNVTSHQGQLSLAIPSLVGAMSTSQRAVTPCGWGVKSGMVRVWVAGKTVIPLLHTGHI